MNKICPLSLVTNKPFVCYKERCMYWVADVEGNHFCMYVDRFHSEYILDRLALAEQQSNEKLNTDIVKKPSTPSYG